MQVTTDGPSDLAREVGRRLAEVRSDRGLSQKQFAAELEVPIASYQRYEQGVRELPLSLAVKLMRDHGVNPAWLLQGPDAAPQKVRSLDEQGALLDQLYDAWEKPIAQSGVPVSYSERRAGFRMLLRDVLQTGRIPMSVITYTHKQLLD